jgi:predicted CopG family antitoxin
MSTKTISIMEDAYEILLSKKYKNESFSEVIRRTIGTKGDIMKFAGAWKEIPAKDIDKMKRDIVSLRERSTLELIKSYKK